MRRSVEVDSIVREARDMARGAGQSLTTAHVLLGMLINPNRARQLLDDLGADAFRIVDSMKTLKRDGGAIGENEGVLDIAIRRMDEAARHTSVPLAGSLHLLLGLVREKQSLAYQLFGLMGISTTEIRTMAIQRIESPAPRGSAAPRADHAAVFGHEPDSTVGVADPFPYLAPAEPQPAPQPVAEAPATRTKEVGPGGDQAELALDGAVPGRKLDPTPDAEPGDGRDLLLDQEMFPLLTSLGRNLSAEAHAGTIDPVIGRDGIIDAMIDTINKRRSNNPVLIGEPGVGKTAIVEGLALAMVKRGERVRALRDRIIVSLDVGSLVAGTELRGAFSRRMARLKDEVRRASGRVIVFIDEIHTLVGAGSGDGALDAANDLKTSLARGEFPCIGATTPQEYHRHIERDPALERRFQPHWVSEPSEEEALAILKGITPHYGSHHGVMYLPEAIEAAVRMSSRYIVERCLPDKAINLIDTAAARAVRQDKETVTVRDVAEVVSEAAQIPVERLLMSDGDRMLQIREFMGKAIVGHGTVLDTIARVIQRNSAGFASKRPIGSFLFIGTTGVGKTETAKVLADFLFCSRDALTRFDMSEYMERHAVSRLLGAAPGYVGHEDPGALTSALTRRPYQIVLFDEIEKAHPDVLNILLQVLDEGHITDAKGRTLSLSNTVIVMTSNLGADSLDVGRSNSIGFGSGSDPSGPATAQELDRLKAQARKALPPELWGRIDEVCTFGPLGRAEVAAIAGLLISESSDQIAEEKGIRYEVDDAVLDHLIDHGGFDPGLGARPMRRAVQVICESALSTAILEGRVTDGDLLQLTVLNGEIAVSVVDEDEDDAE